MTQTEISDIPAKIAFAGLFRRLFAIFYDSFLLTAILFTVSAIATAIKHGKAVETGDTLYPVFILIVFSLSFLYFTWFWVHGGQTLGMKTWQIQIRTGDDADIDWKTASIRFFVAIVSWAICGAGFLWSLFDKKRRGWHDLASKTVLLDLRNR